MSQDSAYDALDSGFGSPSPRGAGSAARDATAQLVVILAGLATTSAVIIGEWYLKRAAPELNLIGFYFFFVLPVGAILLGLICGSGYSFASWTLGRKVNGGLLWGVVLLQATAYVIIHYVEFRALDLRFGDGTPVGFLPFFHVATQAMELKFGRGGAGTGPLGLWGYAFRLLELIGFIGGGLIAPLVLSAKHYCDHCRVYYRGRELGRFAAAVPDRKVKKSDVAGQEALIAEQTAAGERAEAAVQALIVAAEADDGPRFRSILSEAAAATPAASFKKHPRYVTASHFSCPKCAEGIVEIHVMIFNGQAHEKKEIAKRTVSAAFADGVA